VCNYFSFGIDARIGYGFDKSRTNSRVLNKGVYCWEGMKKMFSNTFRVNHILHTVEHYKEEDPESPEVNDDDGKNKSISKIEFNNEKFLLFPSAHKDQKPTHSQVMKGNPSVFLCLNIPSYMGGASNPWAAAKGKSGVTDHENRPIKDFNDQMFGDGKLEIISFNGPLALALERFVKGQGRRVGQAEGPFALNFKRSEDPNKPLNTYAQIDGEFFELIAPKCVKICSARDIPNGKVRVLKNRAFHMKSNKMENSSPKKN